MKDMLLKTAYKERKVRSASDYDDQKKQNWTYITFAHFQMIHTSEGDNYVHMVYIYIYSMSHTLPNPADWRTAAPCRNN